LKKQRHYFKVSRFRHPAVLKGGLGLNSWANLFSPCCTVKGGGSKTEVAAQLLGILVAQVGESRDYFSSKLLASAKTYQLSGVRKFPILGGLSSDQISFPVLNRLHLEFQMLLAYPFSVCFSQDHFPSAISVELSVVISR